MKGEAMAPRVGERVSELTFLRPDGTPVGPGEFAGRVLVVILVRHLG